MNNYSRKMAHYRAGLETMSTGERAAIKAAMVAAMNNDKDILLRIADIAAERDRANRKRVSNWYAEKKRMLIGVRAPRDLAGDIKELARIRGTSVYRLVMDALERMSEEYKEELRKNPPEPVSLDELFAKMKPEKSDEIVRFMEQHLSEKYDKTDTH